MFPTREGRFALRVLHRQGYFCRFAVCVHLERAQRDSVSDFNGVDQGINEHLCL